MAARSPPEKEPLKIRFVAYNSRYLILPWVEVRFLASHLLARMTRELSAAWEQAYGHPVYFVETFVDPTRFRGTCYRAAFETLFALTNELETKGTSIRRLRKLLLLTSVVYEL